MTSWSLKNKKALIIDDLPDMRSMLRIILQSLDCECINIARDAKEALGFIQKDRFDFILCDYNLGAGKDGQQILEEAKYRDILPCSTVFMMITAESTSQMVMGMLDWMPDDYVQKPITKMILSTRLRKLLDRKAALVEVSNALQSGKDYAKALRICNEMLTGKSGTSFELLKLKAELLIKNGDYERAIIHCKKIFQIREVDSIGLLLGQALFFTGQYDEAEVTLKKILANNKNYTLAYDLLAKIKTQFGNLIEAQHLLECAIEQSPKSILRQRELGDIYYKNGNFSAAEKAFKQAVKLGEHSCFKSAKDYTGLANVLAKNNRSVEAIKLIHTIKHDFRNDKASLLDVSMVEANLFKEMKKDELSLQAVSSALALLEKNSENTSNELMLSFAETCLALDQTEQALRLVERAVRNKPDDASMLVKIREAFANKSMSDDIERVIEKSSREVKEINLCGIQLAQQGKIEESIALFVKTARSLPQNATINLNAAHSLIIQMTQRGVNREDLQLVKQFLENVREINPTNKKLKDLLKKLVYLHHR